MVCLDPLRLHPGVALRLIGPGEVMPPADLMLLPGSTPRPGLLGFETTLAHLDTGALGRLPGLAPSR